MRLFNSKKVPFGADEVEKWLYRKCGSQPFNQEDVRKSLGKIDSTNRDKIEQKFPNWYDVRGNVIVIAYHNKLFRIENTEANLKKFANSCFIHVEGASYYYNI